ncbi:MAG: fibronectin type III domain-containing protein [Bacteroidia bacterium]
MKRNTLLSMMFALPILAMAQSFPSETGTLPTPTTVNVSELAEYEIANPPVVVMQDFEEDEDEKGMISRNAPITEQDMANTVKFNFDFSPSRAASPAPAANFNALDDNGTSIPPDIHAAAGPNHLMVTLNSQYRIQNKTGTVISTVTANGFWAGTGGTNPSTFDPKIIYDSYSSRWVIVSCAGAQSSSSALLVAVSQSNDPTGSWYRFLIDADAANTNWFDYPSLGINKDWIVITGNMFTNSGSSYSGGKAWVLNKTNAYAGTTTGLTTINSGTNTFTLCPAITYDNTLSTVYLVQEYNANSGGAAYLQLYTLTGTTPTLAVSGTFSTNLPYNDGGNSGAPQTGTTNKITTNDSRIQNVVYRNGSIYITHSVFLPTTTPTRTSVQWWKVNPVTRAVEQAGRIDDATGTNHYAFPSIMVNASNDVALGFSRFSGTTYASAGYAIRYASDPVNTFNDPYIYKAGANTYYKTFGGADNRWGDYTATALDPDGSTFWLVQEYARSTVNSWGTWWAKVTATAAAPCASAPTGLSTSNLAATTVTLNWAASSGATSYNIQYKTNAATTWTTTTSTTNSKALTGLTASTLYNFQVQAVCSAASSAYSATTNFTTTAAPCATAPTGLATTNLAATTVTLNWTASTGATSYNIQYKTNAATTWTTTTSTTNSKAITGLTASTLYNFKVQAVCSAASSAYSAVANFTTTATPCATAPTGLATTNLAATSVTLNWAASSGATSYNVQYKTNAATTWITTTSTTNSKALTGLTASTLYNFKVQAVCSAASSAYSATVNFTTLASTACTDVGESNNTLATASTLALNTNLTAQISSATDLDYYAFTTTAIQNLSIILTTLPADYDMRLYNSAGTQVGSSQNSGTTGETMTYPNAPAGTYKVYVYGYSGAFSNTVCYTLKASTSAASNCTNSYEPNETFGAAMAITPNIDIKGQIATATDKDYLKFTTTAASAFTATLSSLPADYDMAIYNSAGTLLGSSQNSGTTNEGLTSTSLAAGTYVIYIYGYGGVFSTTCYNLKLSLANGSFAPVKEGEEMTEDLVKVANEMQLVPNPASERVTIFFTHDKDEVVRLELFDATGREVRKYNVGLLNTDNKFDIDLIDLSSGLYTVRMKGENWVKTQKLVINAE